MDYTSERATFGQKQRSSELLLGGLFFMSRQFLGGLLLVYGLLLTSGLLPRELFLGGLHMS